MIQRRQVSQFFHIIIVLQVTAPRLQTWLRRLSVPGLWVIEYLCTVTSENVIHVQGEQSSMLAQLSKRVLDLCTHLHHTRAGACTEHEVPRAAK